MGSEMESVEIFKKIFIPELPCQLSPTQSCKPCCWHCKFLHKCAARWKKKDKYCYQNNTTVWCSAAFKAYIQTYGDRNAEE